MSDFPVLTLRGGPHGLRVEALIDGKKPEKTTRIVVDTGVNDVCRAILYQLVELDVEIEAIVSDGGTAYKASVRFYDDHFGETDIRIPVKRLSVTADTPWQALYDVGRQLELEAPQEVAPGGTI